MKTKAVVAIIAGLLLLCACTKPENATSTATETPSRAIPPAPTPTTSPRPTATSLLSPASAAESPDTDVSVSPRVEHSSADPVADLSIQAQAPGPAIAREETVYTLTIHNLGPNLATGIVLTDALPAGVVPVWTQYPQPLCVRQGTAVGCNMGELQGNDSATVTLDISINGTDTPITGTQFAGLTLDSSAPACTFDHDENRSNVTCYVPTLERDADVQLRVAVSVASGIQGPIVHTATVSANEYDTDRTNNRAAFTMTVDAPMALAVTPDPTSADLSLQAEGPFTVIAGQPFTYTFTVTNRGALEATRVTFLDTLPPATDLIAYKPDAPPCEQVNDTLTCQLHSLESGDPVTFTLVITGNAEQPISLGLDPLAPGWPICAVIRERSYLDLLNCSLGALKQGEAAQVELVLVARGIRERKMVNTAIVNADEPELNALDNTLPITIAVEVEADLSVRSMASRPIVADGVLSYTLTVKNDGPSDANDVIFADTLPPGTTVVSTAASQGEGCQVDILASSVVCVVDRIDGGEAVTVTIGIAVDPSTETIRHSATVRAGSDDPDLGNNELTESVPTQGGAPSD